jgi:hypothetical protein
MAKGYRGCAILWDSLKKFIKPTVDYAFKHFLGRDSTRSILINVLDSVRNPAPGQHTQVIDMLNPFNPKEALADKYLTFRLHSVMMKAAERAEKRGLAEGEKFGVIRTIQLCERLLNKSATPVEQLHSLGLEDLKRLADTLESQALPK